MHAEAIYSLRQLCKAIEGARQVAKRLKAAEGRSSGRWRFLKPELSPL